MMSLITQRPDSLILQNQINIKYLTSLMLACLNAKGNFLKEWCFSPGLIPKGFLSLMIISLKEIDFVNYIYAKFMCNTNPVYY